MNLFYLIGGLWHLLATIGRALEGKKEITSELKESNLSELTKSRFSTSWHEITITFLVMGVALVLISIFDTVIGIDFLAILIISIIIGKIAVYILFPLRNYPSVFKQIITPVIIYVILVILILLGIIF